MSKQKLPALKIIGASFGNSGVILKSIFTIFWPILLLGAAASYFLLVSYTTTSHTGSQPVSGTLAMILYLALLVSFIPVTICWTEHVITKQPPRFNFDKRIIAAIGYGLLIIAIFYIPILLAIFAMFALGQEAGMGTGLGAFLFIGFFVFWLSLTMRFSLVLPAISVGNEKTRMSRSWELTKGYQIKLLSLFVLPNILIAIPTNIIDKIMGTIIYDQTSFILFTSFTVFLTIYGYLLFSEIAGRVFVFFHVPQKLDEYL